MTSPTDEELKPCPFCGGAAEQFFGVVSCKSSMCGARLSCDGRIDSAIQGWNRRAAALSREGEGWREIGSAPKDGTGIVAFVPGFAMGSMVLFWLDGKWREPANHLALRVDPTHWMPLPPAPPSQRDDVA